MQVAELQIAENGLSGTEPLVRVMVEAADESQAQAVAQRLADSVRVHLALR